MKIGIITYHRAENYGALLQAYALRSFLSKKGYDVSFIDYWPDYHSEYFKIFSISRFSSLSFKQKVWYLKVFLLLGWRKYRRHLKFQQFIREELKIKESTPTFHKDDDFCSGYDCVIYGSDQIWRKQGMPSHRGFDFWYFASDNISCSKKIAYAGSMGVVKVEEEETKMLKSFFSKFSSISVRESDLQQYLAFNGINADIVLDPVFLIERDSWKVLASSQSTYRQKPLKYILFYNLLRSEESVIFTNALSLKTGLPIIEVTGVWSFRECPPRYVTDASIQQFLDLIDSASIVVSNSFHGVAFSIIFEKDFYAVGLLDKASRIDSLLTIASIPERHCSLKALDLPLAPISYSQVWCHLKPEIEKSKDYLLQSIIR